MHFSSRKIATLRTVRDAMTVTAALLVIVGTAVRA
jgi:hypothetical protein